MPKLEDLYKKHIGQDIYIIGTGPSFALFPKEFLKDKITIGLNQAYKLINTTYSLTIHPYLIPLESKKWSSAWITKTKVSDETYKAHLENGNYKRFYLFKNNNDPLNFDYLFPDKRPKNCLYVGCGIHTGAMHLACLMGAKTLYLIGCDFGYCKEIHHCHNQHIELHNNTAEEVYAEYWYYALKVRKVLEKCYKLSILQLSYTLGIPKYTELELNKEGYLTQNPPQVIEKNVRNTPLVTNFIP